MAITKTKNKSSGNAQLKSDGSTASRLITPAKPKNVNIKVSPNHPINKEIRRGFQKVSIKVDELILLSIDVENTFIHLSKLNVINNNNNSIAGIII